MLRGGGKSACLSDAVRRESMAHQRIRIRSASADAVNRSRETASAEADPTFTHCINSKELSIMVTPLARRTALSRLALCCSLMATAFATCVAAAADEKPSPLPLKKVVLFNSGVGFFEHKADVEGDAKVDLKFNVGDINDLLKSMVLQDLGGGKVSTVTYGSMDPITKTLKTFAIDLTNNPTMADLLRQVRGETVDVDRCRPSATRADRHRFYQPIHVAQGSHAPGGGYHPPSRVRGPLLYSIPST